MNRSRFSKAVSMFVTTVITMSGMPSMVLADVIGAPTYYTVQTNLSYEINTNVTSSWINHESVDFVVTNTGDETIHNWYITFNTPYVIDNIWNGAMYETDGNGTYTITSNGWNQDIHPGESVTVGATFSSATETEISVDPQWYLLNTQATVVDASQYTLDYIEYSAWESGFTGQLTLTSMVDCQHWQLSFDSNREITAVSSAVLNSEGDYSYEITHDENNMRLFANNAYNFGIQGVSSEESLTLSNVELTAVDLAYHLTDDVDGNGVPDYLEFIGGGIIVEPTPTPTPVPTETPTTTPTEEPTGTPATEPSETETPTPTEEPTPTPVIDYDLDRDLDGLPDYIEEQIGTDPLKADTDDDGLSDYIEAMIGYNPTNSDTNGNGITDGNEDYDNDGISNVQELSIGTNMAMVDTDGDNLNDGDEINTYGTDPLDPDTDGDGIKDGDEISIGKNPSDSSDGATRIPQTFTQTINNPEDASITSVDVTISVANKINRVVDVNDYYNVDVYSTGVNGRIGNPLNFECEEDFDTATVVIHYDEASLGETSEENIGVLWYDEETGFYIVQEQAVIDTTNNTVTLVLDHFSTYVLVDLNKWNNPQITPTTALTGNIHEANALISWHRENGVILPPENFEAMAWQNYITMNGGLHSQDTRLELIDSGYFIDSFGFLSYTYTWRVLTNDFEDNDQDGVPDALETNGVYAYGQDNVFYTSLTSSEDSDGDNVSDLEEYRSIYLISKSSEDGSISVRRITSDGQEVLESDSVLYELAVSYVDSVLDSGETFAFCTPRSNPNNSDTDRDYYRDNNDNHPMRNGLVTIGLGGANYNMFDQDVEGYIHVNNAPSNPSTGYGGHQGWFTDENINENGLNIPDSGCGLIATNDILLYLNNGVQEYEWDDYQNEVLSTYSDFYSSQFWQTYLIPNPFAMSPLFIQECLLYNGYLSSEYIVDSSTLGGSVEIANTAYIYNSLLDDIENSLRNNRPVILMEYDVFNYQKRKHEMPYQSLPMYQINGGAQVISEFMSSTSHMEYHYVTITGMIINRNANCNDNESVYLRVQSWGREYYIKYNEFISYNCSTPYDFQGGRIIFID